MKLIHPSVKFGQHLEYAQMLSLVCKAISLCYGKEPPTGMVEQEDYIRKRLATRHESVLEHVGFSVTLTTDRGITHELVRHRLCSFTQESTRYCDYSSEKQGWGGLTFIIPPEFLYTIPGGEYVSAGIGNRSGDGTVYTLQRKDGSFLEIPPLESTWALPLWAAEDLYKKARKSGLSIETARGLLPNALKAQITMTANMREWKHIFDLRSRGLTGRPHPQMKQVMDMVYEEAQRRFPVFFPDKI